jgi:hypothetical protein
MSKLGDQVRGRLERLAKKIEVAEWGEDGEPLALYFYPLSINDSKKISAHVKGLSDQSREMEYVYFIVFNARTEHGELAFDLADVEWISNQPLNLIVDVYLSANDRKGFSETLKK